jgi:hypothetical protein
LAPSGTIFFSYCDTFLLRWRRDGVDDHDDSA